MLPEQAHIAWKRLKADLELADNLGAKSLPVENMRKRMKDLEAGLPVQASFLGEEEFPRGQNLEAEKPPGNGAAAAAAAAGEAGGSPASSPAAAPGANGEGKPKRRSSSKTAARGLQFK